MSGACHRQPDMLRFMRREGIAKVACGLIPPEDIDYPVTGHWQGH
jgi:hypothetical protein